MSSSRRAGRSEGPASVVAPARRFRRIHLGLLLGVAGLLSVVLGWVSVSGTRVLYDQLTYIAGAGIFGLFLLGVAQTIFIIDFVNVQAQATNELRESLLDLRTELLDDVPAYSSGTDVGMVDGDWNNVTSGGGDGTTLLAIRGARRVHRDNCPLVIGKTTARELSVPEAMEAELLPCRICGPVLQPLEKGEEG